MATELHEAVAAGHEPGSPEAKAWETPSTSAESPDTPDSTGLTETYDKAELMTGGGWCIYVSANFVRLDLGCTKADFCNGIVFQHFSISTRLSDLSTAVDEK